MKTVNLYPFLLIWTAPFNADNKLLNSLGKMVRAKIVDRYKDRIDYLYTPEAKNIVNPGNLEAIKIVLKIG